MPRYAITRGSELVAVYDNEAQARGALDSYGEGCEVAPYQEAELPAKVDPAAHDAGAPAPAPAEESVTSPPAAPPAWDDESKTPPPSIGGVKRVRR
jgi:hypothetical protein